MDRRSMSGRTVSVASLLGLLCACSGPLDGRRLVDEAAAALGGADRVRAVTVLSMTGEGTQGNLGQDMRPESRELLFTVSGYRRELAFVNGAPRMRTELTRTPQFAYFQGQDAQRQVTGLANDIAYTVGPNGTATRASASVTRDRQAELYHHPLTAVRAALESPAAVSNPRDDGAEQVVDLRTQDGVSFVLAIDRSTHLPVRVITRAAHPNLGDVVVETRFADYRPVDGLNLPTRLISRTDEFVTSDLQLAEQHVNRSESDLAAPVVAAASATPAPAAPKVAPEKVADGLWLMGGGSHHSVLVEFCDHLTVIEAPQSEERTLAVIAEARRLIPGKPLTQLVTSHHHFDHTAGLRAAVSEGLEVITDEGNVEFVEEMVRRPHTMVPDALARKPATLKLTSVGEERTLEDPARTMVLYPIPGNPHGETMLMAWFPRERILVQADAFGSGPAVAPYAPNLLENIQRRQLAVERLVSLHGPVAPFSALEAAAARAATR